MLEKLNSDLAAVGSRGRSALVRLEARGRGIGGGTVWHQEGLILTNAHVAQGTVTVALPDGRRLGAKLLASDKKRDLAALSVEANGLPVVELGDSRALKPGDVVVALGHPWGVEGAATAGIVIDTGVPLELRSPIELLQVSLQLRPGHSGGPLLDVHGRLVGVNTMMAGPSAGFAVPVHEIKAFLHENLGRGGH
jgi:S1-C subfamily serine protease